LVPVSRLTTECRANSALKIRLQVSLPTRPLQTESALQSCITTKGLCGIDLALISLRTTFGGSPCPSIFSEISETVTYLTNAIIHCSDYDPVSFPSHYSHLLGPAKVEPDHVPLAAARSLMIDHEADEFVTADVFFDDIFSAIPQLDGDSPGDRGAQAALLALDVLGRPLLPDGGESLPRDNSLPSTRQSPKAPRRKG